MTQPAGLCRVRNRKEQKDHERNIYPGNTVLGNSKSSLVAFINQRTFIIICFDMATKKSKFSQRVCFSSVVCCITVKTMEKGSIRVRSRLGHPIG